MFKCDDRTKSLLFATVVNQEKERVSLHSKTSKI